MVDCTSNMQFTLLWLAGAIEQGACERMVYDCSVVWGAEEVSSTRRESCCCSADDASVQHTMACLVAGARQAACHSSALSGIRGRSHGLQKPRGEAQPEPSKTPSTLCQL